MKKLGSWYNQWYNVNNPVRLATKLIKLTSDDKREVSLRKGSKGRAIELEDTVIELQERVRELEKHKANLMGRVSILRQQLDTRGKRHTQYDRVQPKVQCVSGTL